MIVVISILSYALRLFLMGILLWQLGELLGINLDWNSVVVMTTALWLATFPVTPQMVDTYHGLFLLRTSNPWDKNSEERDYNVWRAHKDVENNFATIIIYSLIAVGLFSYNWWSA